jgi:glutamine amidotransferase
VANAFEAISAPAVVVTEPSALAAADAVVLPGVGSFGDGMRNLRSAGFVEALETEVRGKGKPYLGICLGLQFLADWGEEGGRHAGLGWMRGSVQRLKPDSRVFKVPHMGWNDVELLGGGGPLFSGLPERPVFYFVHGYHFIPEAEDTACLAAVCDHGERVTAAVQKGLVYGVQFHPEKSQEHGIALLRNFVQVARGAVKC